MSNEIDILFVYLLTNTFNYFGIRIYLGGPYIFVK